MFKKTVMGFKYLCCLFVICLSATLLHAQCPIPTTSNCDVFPNSEIKLSSANNIDFVFDGFSKYYGGITQSGSTILRLKIAPNNGSCKWMLRVYIDNNPTSGSSLNEWEKVYGASTSGAIPTLDLLQLRIYNACQTPILNNIYRTFTAVNSSYLDIVSSNVLIPAGSCTTNVNGAGSYLTNYGEYSFTIDYRIVPNLYQAPGNYQMSLKFCLVEVM